MNSLIKGFGVALLSAALAGTLSANPAHAGRMAFASAPSAPSSSSDVSELRPPDPHKELRHLSKNLRLTRGQRTVVDSILQERTREIHLLLDVQSLSEEYRNTLATKVMQDSNAQIATLLRNKQKRRFDKVLARNGRTL